jgi:hypothetical protein
MSGVRVNRWLGLAGIVGGALWIVWAAALEDEWAGLLAAILVAFLATLRAVVGKFGPGLGPVGAGAIAVGAIGLAVMLLGALAELGSALDAGYVIVAGGLISLAALVVAGVVGARRLEGAPQWLLALAAGSFSAIPLWEISFGLGFALLGAAVVWPAPETLALHEETA